MLKKQHIDFKGKLLAVLFLFFNCVCTAAPVLKLISENQADTVSIRLVQNPLENEEENHATSSGYINHVNHFSVRKHCNNRVCNTAVTNGTVSLSAIVLPVIYIPDASKLPVPGMDAFLFRYTLF